MSPRSNEFLEQARDRATMAGEVLQAGHLEGAVSAGYYAMLYAARAALSELDEYARSHGGTWHLFYQRFVVNGAFDQHLHALAQSTQDTREKGDYEAITPTREEAERIVEGAAEYIAAVEQLLGTQSPKAEQAADSPTATE